MERIIFIIILILTFSSLGWAERVNSIPKMTSEGNVQKVFYDSGELLQEAIQNEGEISGSSFRQYYESGILKFEGKMGFNNKRNAYLPSGIWKKYYENGNIEKEINHKEGQRVNYKFYDEEGNLIDTREYGINENQLIESGQYIYRTYTTARSSIYEEIELTIYYKGTDGKNILVESVYEDIRDFKLPMDTDISVKQAYMNTPLEDKTVLIKVVDENNRIIIEETGYQAGRYPIRFYPDLMKAVSYKSDDFQIDDSELKRAFEEAEDLSQ